MRVYTPEGERALWSNRKLNYAKYWMRLITLDNRELFYSSDQLFFSPEGKPLRGKKLKPDDWIKTEDGKARVKSNTVVLGARRPGNALFVYSLYSAYYVANGILVGYK